MDNRTCTDALPSRGQRMDKRKHLREKQNPSCGVCWHDRCEHKLQERVAHVPASRSDNVCVRLSTQSSAHNTEENCNAHGPEPVGKREKRSACVEPELKMRRSSGS